MSGWRWLWNGFWIGGAVWIVLIAAGGAMSGDVSPYGGGLHWQAAGMDVWRSFTCLALSLGIIVLYRDRFDGQGPIARFLTRNSFGVYVLHAPILVTITRLLHFLSASIALKFSLASLGGVLASFLIVGVVARRIPGLRAVL